MAPSSGPEAQLRRGRVTSPRCVCVCVECGGSSGTLGSNCASLQTLTPAPPARRALYVPPAFSHSLSGFESRVCAAPDGPLGCVFPTPSFKMAPKINQWNCGGAASPSRRVSSPCSPPSSAPCARGCSPAPGSLCGSICDPSPVEESRGWTGGSAGVNTDLAPRANAKHNRGSLH